MLKKLIISFLFSFCSLLTQQLQAQYYDHSFGVRGGTDLQLSYNRFLFFGPEYMQQSLEILGGAQFDVTKKEINGYLLQAFYKLHTDVGFDTGFGAYAGLGLLGGWYTRTGRTNVWGGGIAATIGMEYTFTHVPINISLDWRPFLAYPRSSLLSFGLTLRYVFTTTWQ